MMTGQCSKRAGAARSTIQTRTGAIWFLWSQLRHVSVNVGKTGSELLVSEEVVSLYAFLAPGVDDAAGRQRRSRKAEMSYVIAAPEMMTAAASDLAAIGSNVSAAHMVTAAPTVAVTPAAADEVSAGIAHLLPARPGLSAAVEAFGTHCPAPRLGWWADAAMFVPLHSALIQRLTTTKYSTGPRLYRGRQRR